MSSLSVFVLNFIVAFKSSLRLYVTLFLPLQAAFGGVAKKLLHPSAACCLALTPPRHTESCTCAKRGNLRRMYVVLRGGCVYVGPKRLSKLPGLRGATAQLRAGGGLIFRLELQPVHRITFRLSKIWALHFAWESDLSFHTGFRCRQGSIFLLALSLARCER